MLVAYGSPHEKVPEILNRAAREHTEVLSYPEPNSIFEGFGNSSIDFQLRFWVRSIDERLRIRTEVAVTIDRLFREEKIDIAFPQLDVHLHDTDNEQQAMRGENSLKIKTEENSNEFLTNSVVLPLPSSKTLLTCGYVESDYDGFLDCF